MRLGKIVLQIRAAKTRFGNFVAGAAELSLAVQNMLKVDMAFVIPLSDDSDRNKNDSGISQKVSERFGVVVALGNDTSDADKTGFTAYDLLHEVRDELFKPLLGWEIEEAMSIVFYRGGRLLGIDPAYLWYQFEFEYDSELGALAVGADEGKRNNGIINSEVNEDQELYPLNTIYADYISGQSDELPYTGELPFPAGFPDVGNPAQSQWLDLIE